MGRPAVRTRSLLRDDVIKITALFGNIRNAERQLGLEGKISHMNFYRAMQFLNITPEEKELIEKHWARWRQLFLRPTVPAHHTLELTSELLEEDPDWLEASGDEAV